MGISIDELLEKYQNIELAMLKIDEDRETLAELMVSRKKTFDKQIAELKSIASSKEKDLEMLQNRIDSISDSYDKRVNALGDLLESIKETADSINESLPDIESQIEEVSAENESIKKRLITLEKQIKELKTTGITVNAGKDKKKSTVKVDYDEELTILEAYEKYEGKLDPIIVVKEKWTKDYCFAITEINGSMAEGIAFRGGKYYRKGSYPLSTLVKMYNGPSTESIIEYLENDNDEEEIPF
jgi:chromosome segregation ATPase